MASQRIELSLQTAERTYHHFSDNAACDYEATGVRSRGRPTHEGAKEAVRVSVDPVSVLLWIVAPLVFWGAVTAGLVLALAG